MTKEEKKIDKLLKSSFTKEEKEKYKKEKVTNEEIEILQEQMLLTSDIKDIESDLVEIKK